MENIGAGPIPDSSQQSLRTRCRENATDTPARIHLFPGVLDELQVRAQRVAIAIRELVFVKCQFQRGAFMHQAEAHRLCVANRPADQAALGNDYLSVDFQMRNYGAGERSAAGRGVTAKRGIESQVKG